MTGWAKQGMGGMGLVVRVYGSDNIERLELWRVSCAGRNCSRRCFGFEEWENPIFCADSVPFCTSGVAWPTWMIASSFGLNFVLVVLVLVHLAVVRVRRDLPFASFGVCDQCQRHVSVLSSRIVSSM
ncbi:hypothetical protein niasHT_008815 [Heterodera trifolii]|uniref:Transmembrane protein n=1 Tax=Heterodera trifolii TaxID=157864 RepID=A0ABD2LSN5_9BILA